MDVPNLVSIISTAAMVGASGTFASEVAKDCYSTLKDRIFSAGGSAHKGGIQAAIKGLEVNPEALHWQAALNAELTNLPVEDDPEIERLAKRLANELPKSNPLKNISVSIRQAGKNHTAQVAGGDIINASKVTRHTTFQPNETHITEGTAKKLYELHKELVEMDISAGVSPQRSAQAWWGKLKQHFEVSTYRAIPREKGDDAIAFLKQAIKMNLPKIRRKDNELWRNKHYQAIHGNRKALGWSDDDVYEFASSKLKKTTTSLRHLGERELSQIARQIRAEARKKKR